MTRKLYSESAKRPNRLLSLLAYVLAIGLLLASIWFAFESQRAEDWSAVFAASPAQILALLFAVIASTIVLPGLQFWLFSAPFVTTASLSLPKMTAVSVASALLNYTPVKAGLIGRIGYLKFAHGIGYRAAMASHALIAASIGIAISATLLATLLSPEFGWQWGVVTLLGLVGGAAITHVVFVNLIPADLPISGPLTARPHVAISYVALGAIVQIGMLAFVALRWWLVFGFLGQSVSFTTAWVLAIIHLVSTSVAPANGLGLREWLVGATGGLAAVGTGSGLTMGQNITVSLVDRSVEAVVVVSFGLLAIYVLRRDWPGLRTKTA